MTRTEIVNADRDSKDGGGGQRLLLYQTPSTGLYHGGKYSY